MTRLKKTVVKKILKVDLTNFPVFLENWSKGFMIRIASKLRKFGLIIFDDYFCLKNFENDETGLADFPYLVINHSIKVGNTELNICCRLLFLTQKSLFCVICSKAVANSSFFLFSLKWRGFTLNKLAFVLPDIVINS